MLRSKGWDAPHGAIWRSSSWIPWALPGWASAATATAGAPAAHARPQWFQRGPALPVLTQELAHLGGFGANNAWKELQFVEGRGKPVIGTPETPFLISPMLSVTHGVEKWCNFGETSKPWKSHLGIGNDVEMGAETWVRTQDLSKIG